MKISVFYVLLSQCQRQTFLILLSCSLRKYSLCDFAIFSSTCFAISLCSFATSLSFVRISSAIDSLSSGSDAGVSIKQRSNDVGENSLKIIGTVETMVFASKTFIARMGVE